MTPSTCSTRSTRSTRLFTSPQLSIRARRAATTTALLTLACAAHATPVLQATLDAPTELQKGEVDRYTLTLINTGSSAAGSPVMRLPLATGQDVAGALPTGCALVQEAIPTLGVVRQVRCTSSTVPARARRAWSFNLRAPLNPATVAHRAYATATSSPALWSNLVQTAYANYNVPITPGGAWLLASCNSATGPLPYNICLPWAEMRGEVLLAVGGVVDSAEGPIGNWLQTDPRSLRIDTAPSYMPDPMVMSYSAINSRCFRGMGESFPPPGGTKVYTASKICRI